MQVDMAQQINHYIKHQEWSKLDQYLQPLLTHEKEGLPASLLYAKTLRLRAQGEQANAILVQCTKHKFHAKVNDWGSLAEELLQAGLWQAATTVIVKVEAALKPMGLFLRLVLLREQEKWVEFDKLATQLRQLAKPWSALAQVQQAWSALRQNLPNKAMDYLSPLLTESNFAVHKLQVRILIAQGNKPQALAILQQLQQQQAHDWEIRALLGLCLTESAQIKTLFDESLAIQPRQADTLTNRAAWYARNGQFDHALHDCEQALLIKAWYDPPLLLSLKVFQAKQQYRAAIEWLDKKIAQYNTPTRVAARLDLLRLSAEKKEVLQQAAEQALKQYPDDPVVLLSVGVIFQTIRQADRAIAAYEKRLSQLPNDQATRNNLAQLWRDQGDIEMAVTEWRAMGNIQDDTIRLNLAQALQQRGDALEAESIYRQILNKQKHNAIALRGLAAILLDQGDYNQALLFAQQALKYSPEHTRSWLIKAKIHGAMGEFDEQQQLLKSGIAAVTEPLLLHQALFRFWRTRQQYAIALEQLQHWAKQDPKEVEYPLMMADIYYAKNDFEATESVIKQAAIIDEEKGGVALVRFYEQRERLGAARKAAEKLVNNKPYVMRHHGLLAEVLQRQERYEEALKALDVGLKIEPHRLSLVRQKVGQLLALERFGEAIKLAQLLVDFKISPPHVNLLLTAYQRSRDHDRARQLCEQVLLEEPNNRLWQLNLAKSLARLHRIEEAITVLYNSLKKHPNNLSVANPLIRYLGLLERYDEARVIVQQISSKIGERPDSIASLSDILRDMGENEQVCQLLQQGIVRFPRHIGLRLKLANIFRRLKQPAKELEAIISLLDDFPPEQVIAKCIKPLINLKAEKRLTPYLQAWQQRTPDNVKILWTQFDIAKLRHANEQALKVLLEIEQHQPHSPNVLSARADLQSEQWEMSKAIKNQQAVCELRPDNASYVAKLLSLQVKAGNFDEFDKHITRLKHLWGDRRYQHYRNFFFNFNCHPTWSAKQVYDFYKDWYEKSVFPNRPLLRQHKNSRIKDRRLKIAYVSPDFRRHAVAYFSEPLLIAHDREQFELFAFAHLEPNQDDEYTARFKSYFHHWIEIANMTNDELEKRIRDERIDILIDLAGHTANNRLSIFLTRPAPVQASWIFGAGQTTGLPEVDYLLTDAAVIPEKYKQYFSEKVKCLPQSGLPFSPAHDYLPPKPLPCLENNYITFGVLSRPLRTNRLTIRVWAQILQRLPTAKLRFDHIPYAEKDIQQRLKAQFLDLGITEEQLIFRNTRPHWQVYQEIDIQLDPFPAGSGTTITEGLWMERVGISLYSRPPMGCIASAMFTALNIEQYCKANSEEAYITKAVSLAKDIDLLVKLSTGLRERMKSSWLMDYEQYGVETATLYRQMWHDYCCEDEKK